MWRIIKTYIFKLILTLVAAFFFHTAQGQLDSTHISISFYNHQTEITPGKTFFNVLTITNHTNSIQHTELNWSLPIDWTILGETREMLSIPPDTTLQMPVRIAVSNQAKGAIGYVVVASLLDEADRPIQSKSCYVTIPKTSSLNVKTESILEYFDPNTGQVNFGFHVENNGNVNELISIDVALPHDMDMPNAEDDHLVFPFEVSPNKDTTINLNAWIKERNPKENRYRNILLTFTTPDTIITKSIWLKYLKHKYTYPITSSKRILVVELSMRDIFSATNKTNVTANIFGSVLLKNNRDIYYSYNNYGTFEPEELWYHSRFYAGYVDSSWHVHLGDILNTNMEMSMNGRGSMIEYSNETHIIRGTVSKSKSKDIPDYKAGLTYSYYLRNNKRLALLFGAAHRQTDYSKYALNSYESKAYLGFVGIQANLNNKHQLMLKTGFSQTQDFYENTQKNNNGMGYSLAYGYNDKKLKFRINSQIGSKNYAGYTQGRQKIYSHGQYELNKTNNVLMNFTHDRVDSRNDDENFILTQRLNLNYHHRLAQSRTTLYTGPYIRHGASSSYYSTNDTSFSVWSMAAKFGVRHYSRENHTINSWLVLGANKVSSFQRQYNYENYPEKPPYFIAQLNFNVMLKHTGLLLSYYHGPYTIHQDLYYFYDIQYSRNFMVMPYYRRFFFDELILLTLRGAYTNDIPSESNRINMYSDVQAFLANNWTLRFFNSTTLQSQTSPNTGNRQTFRSSYFEFSVRKEFGWQQPREKYHDVEVIFFKDYNGNFKKDTNEPGVKNVLVHLEHAPEYYKKHDSIMLSQDSLYKPYHENLSRGSNSAELISDQYGFARYENLREGPYRIKAFVLEKMKGNFSISTEDSVYFVNRDYTIKEQSPIYIPFLENNKIIGRIIMNRAKFTPWGDFELGNIKITAKDTRGMTYQTLTNSNGEFVLFVPNTDSYEVTINNIFHEYFTLQQQMYDVRFNGYKQFEVTFVFNEKSRQRVITPMVSDTNTYTLKPIQRVNINGTVTDLESGQPISARLTVKGRTSNDIVAASTSSIARTGFYMMQFPLKTDYTLFVSKNGYWNHVEELNFHHSISFQDKTINVALEKMVLNERIDNNKLLFEKDMAEIDHDKQAELVTINKRLNANETVKIEIGGHISADEDPTGSDNLARKRAEWVKEYLMKYNVEESRMLIRDYGSSDPEIANATGKDRAQNRRVTIKILKY